MIQNLNPNLGNLSNPLCFTKDLLIKGEDHLLLRSHLEKMLTIRYAEEKIAENIENGIIRCPCHLAIGQEAIPVGLSCHLRKTDHIFGNHRSHGHYLACGGDLRALFAEVLGKASGCSKGMGGSMHLIDATNGFKGSVPIVAGTVSLAVGAALAAKFDRQNDMDVGISYFGDGACEEGSVHESLNFAAKFKLPVLFVCENNLFSSHLSIELRQPYNSVARYAVVNNIMTEVLDGNDVVAVSKAASKLIARARSGEGPGFIEAVTYRWRGHVGPKEDIDVGLKRKDDLIQWKKRDPIKRLKNSLLSEGIMSDSDLSALEMKIKAHVDECWKKALEDPYPPVTALLDLVYANGVTCENKLR